MDAITTYKQFLDGIKKESTSTVTPDAFNRLFNKIQLDVIVSKLSKTELESKRIEDLSQLLQYKIISPDVVGSNNFTIPRTGEFGFAHSPSDKILKLLNVAFKIVYEGHECINDSESGYISAEYLRTDEKYSIFNNPFRVPTLSPPYTRIYYQLYENRITVIFSNNTVDSFASKMKIEYYRYPIKFNFDKNNPDESIDCEFKDELCQEIIDHTVMYYLENITDPNFQSKYLRINNNNNNNTY